MKKHILTTSFGALISLFLIAGTSGVASAHVLKEDNGISAVLHIPPAQQTQLDFSFSSQQSTFSLKNCDCQVIVQANGNTIQTEPLGAGSEDSGASAAASVTFPSIGVYDVIVEGSAKDGAFKSFKLDYVERVATSAVATTSQPVQRNGSTVLLISATSFILLLMGAYAAIRQGGRYRA